MCTVQLPYMEEWQQMRVFVSETLVFAMLSSEKFELAQDELESLMERLQGEVDSLGSAQGEARKRAIQVI